MRHILAAIIAVLAMGCRDPFVEKDGHFVVHNTSPNPITVHINDGEGHVVRANDNTRFDFPVEIPRTPRPSGYFGPSFGPSNIDKTVMVSVSVKNLMRGTQTRGYSCGAGAKVITTVNYRVDAYGDYIDCTWTTPYAY